MLMAWALVAAEAALCQVSLDTGWHHLRNTGPREWSSFPLHTDKKKLSIAFAAEPDGSEHTLSLRQYDVKLNWRVLLNGQPLGSLTADEKDLISYFAVPSQILKTANILEISSDAPQPDDIRVGMIVLHRAPVSTVLSGASLDIEVADAETGALIPARLTITNGEGILQLAGGPSGSTLAIRPGFVYTGNGKASIGLPPGQYKIYAGRGFEYGVDSAEVIVKKGEHARHRFSIRREVSTPGWVSSDTHIHTLTWSGHGDASAPERVLTIAGEGLELPIITEHNLQVDMRTIAEAGGVARYFTPVTGNEVTTAVGHFNVFPLPPDKTVVDHRHKTWSSVSEKLRAYEDSKVIILNHAHDIHADFRPFDPRIHLSSAGMRLDGWNFPANAMEVINSGAQQTDRMELTRDWFGMLNHGHFITPAGSSDSHDVSRYIVGQARTYIRCSGEDPANLDVEEAVRNFREGNVMVSFGLLAEIEINDAYGPGELVPASDEFKVAVKVSGPAWTRADRVMLYANGKKIREQKIDNPRGAGIKWSGTWNLTIPSHDVFLVAVAEGPDNHSAFWPIARPYQPVSPDWTGGVFGISGAVWLDADSNSKRDAAVHYATRLTDQYAGDPGQLMQELAAYDEAVAIQVAALLHKRGRNLKGTEITKALGRATDETKSGFETVIRELKLK